MQQRTTVLPNVLGADMSERIDFDKHPNARYHLGGDVLDRLPYLSFLIAGDRPASTPLSAMPAPIVAARLVNARRDRVYGKQHVTSGGRLLYHFWSAFMSGPGPEEPPVRSVGRRGTLLVKARAWAWIIKPGEPEFELLDAFKIACDHRVNKHVSDGLLRRALGLT